jgi:outer membrane protein OmpA-like peptidoglycan-associated protein
MLDVILSVREAFHNPVSLNSTEPEEQVLIQRLLERHGQGRSKQPGIEGEDEQATATKPTEFHSQAGNIRFADNAAALSPDAKRTIAEIARKVRGTNLIVDVRGHASATEALGSTDRAMRLAVERSLAVAEALVDQEIDWRQLRLVGSADTDRVSRFPGSRDEDRANARVEVVISDEVVPEEVPTDPVTAQE